MRNSVNVGTLFESTFLNPHNTFEVVSLADYRDEENGTIVPNEIATMRNVSNGYTYVTHVSLLEKSPYMLRLN